MMVLSRGKSDSHWVANAFNLPHTNRHSDSSSHIKLLIGVFMKSQNREEVEQHEIPNP
jgi:hypothetical protein